MLVEGSLKNYYLIDPPLLAEIQELLPDFTQLDELDKRYWFLTIRSQLHPGYTLEQTIRYVKIKWGKDFSKAFPNYGLEVAKPKQDGGAAAPGICPKSAINDRRWHDRLAGLED